MASLKREFLSGTFYIGIAKYTGIVAQLVITAVLARILTPDDYGIITIAAVFIAFFNILSDIGIGVAVIQQKDFTKKDLDYLFSLSIYIGLVLTLILFSCSGLISKFYNSDELMYVCRWLCISVFFTCARIVPMNLLYREKKFKYIALTNLCVQIICGGAAIIVAFRGWGVYALVLSQVLSAFLLFIIYAFKYPRHFHVRVNLSPFKRVFSYSTYNFAGTIFIYFTQNIDKLLVGKYIGASPLGFYEKSYNLVFLPINNITFVITPVLHPIFSEYQFDLSTLAQKYFKIIGTLAYLSFPLSVLLYFISKEAILLFYGNQWIPAIEPFKIMSLSVCMLMLDTTVGAIYNASNQTKRGFFTMLIMACVMISSISSAIWGWGSIVAVAYAFLTARIITTIINFYSLTKGLKINISIFIDYIKRPLIIGLILFGIFSIMEIYIDSFSLIASLIIKGFSWVFLTLSLIYIFGNQNIIKILFSKLRFNK